MTDFNDFIQEAGIQETLFTGSKYTWCNNHMDLATKMWCRLDRVFVNSVWSAQFCSTEISHLARVDSDHSPIIIYVLLSSMKKASMFRFQNMWVDHPDFWSW